MWLGVDTGGTFTDLVLHTGDGIRFHKVLSTPDNPAEAILQGIAELGIDPAAVQLVHGSTVATNAILERKGVRTLFITNHGLEDTIAIGRQTRARLYDLCPPSPSRWPAVEDCLGIAARTGADGRTLASVSETELKAIAEKAASYEAVAVCLLFSFLDTEHEKAIAEAIPDHIPVSLSSEVLPEHREYERATTTFLNAYVAPKVSRYLAHLRDRMQAREFYVMHSAGGLMHSEDAVRQAVRMVLSGPAGGLAAAQAIGAALDLPRMISFDMGGTSTDVALLDGEPRITTESHVADLPVAIPMLDIHTIGAGGGSLAWVDTAGLLQVGPKSSGAVPGPVCYGRGGRQPTVTDANVVLGRLPADTRLGGSLNLDAEAARAAMADMATGLHLDVEELAAGIIRIAEEKMAGAIRTVSEQRGYDPKRFTLLCFGGAGGMHACALAERMRMRHVIVPTASGAFSALGMLCSQHRLDTSRSRPMPLAPSSIATLEHLFSELEAENARRMPGRELRYRRMIDLHYAGQGSSLTLPWNDSIPELIRAFEAAHELAYGHRLDRPVAAITLRVSATADTPTVSLPEWTPTTNSEARIAGHTPVHSHGLIPYYAREALCPGHALSGPAIIVEATATIWLPPAWTLSVAAQGHLLLVHGKDA
jgi:N-methylhydantoinase A